MADDIRALEERVRALEARSTVKAYGRKPRESEGGENEIARYSTPDGERLAVKARGQWREISAGPTKSYGLTSAASGGSTSQAKAGGAEPKALDQGDFRNLSGMTAKVASEAAAATAALEADLISHDHSAGIGGYIPYNGLLTPNAPAVGDVLMYDGSQSIWTQNRTFLPFSITKNVGGAEAGTAADAQYVDGAYYSVAEIAGTPGFDIEFNFLGVDESINRLTLHMWYQGSAIHNVEIGIYNYNTASYVVLGTINGQSDWTALEYEITPSGDYVSGGDMKIRFYHSSAGNAAHDLLIDRCVLRYEILSGGGITEHGLLSGLLDDDHSQYLLASGTRALSADWDAGGFEIRAQTFESDVATGTAPFTIASTTLVTNLNADMLDGSHAADFAAIAHTHAGTDITGLTASMALVSTAGGAVAASATISATELGYLNGVTSSIQNQLTARTTWVSPWFGLERVLVSDAAVGGQVNQTGVALADLLRVNGTLALTADWDAGAYEIRALTFESDITTMAGAPFTVASTALVSNLNADMVDGVHAATILQSGGTVALTADWDAGSYEIRAQTFESDVATGTAPLVVASTTMVNNLKSEYCGEHILVYATSDHTINNSDAYTADTTFAGISLEANSYYSFEAAIVWRLVTSANPDWKVRFYFDQTDWTMFCTYTAAATASANDSSGTNYCTIGAIANTATGSRLNVFHGTIKTVTAGTFRMEWAQNAATAEDTIRRAPSWMKFHKLNP